MEAIQGLLVALTEALQDFVLEPDLRLLHVLTDSDLRITILEHVAAAEHNRANRTPFVFLEAPAEPEDTGWLLRSQELKEELEAYLGEAGDLDDNYIPPREEELLRDTGDLRHFGLELAKALQELPDGLTVVLAPLQVSAPARWVSDILALLKPAELERARFIVVELESSPVSMVVRKLGPKADSVDARMGARSARKALEMQLQAMVHAPPGSSGPQVLGAAGPKVAPPRRKDELADEDVSKAQERDLDKLEAPRALAEPEVGRDLRGLLLASAIALGKEDNPEAVRLQKQAVELCRREGLVREEIVLQLMLAGSLVQLERTSSALEVLEEARTRAKQEELFELEVQVLLMRGMALALAKRPEEAALAYEEAGRIAGERGLIELAIEAYRACGELLVRTGRVEQAIEAWRRALVLAESAPSDVVSQSSAPEMARSLALLCRKHGMSDHTLMLEEKADAFENPPPDKDEEQELEQPEEKEENEPPTAAPAPPDLKQTLRMVITDIFPREGDERDAEEKEESKEKTRQWAEEVSASGTGSFQAVSLEDSPTYEELFGDAQSVNYERDANMPPTARYEAVGERPFGGNRGVSYRDPSFSRTLELVPVDVPRAVQAPILPPRATQIIRPAEFAEIQRRIEERRKEQREQKKKLETSYTVKHRSMKLAPVVLPEKENDEDNPRPDK